MPSWRCIADAIERHTASQWCLAGVYTAQLEEAVATKPDLNTLCAVLIFMCYIMPSWPTLQMLESAAMNQMLDSGSHHAQLVGARRWVAEGDVDPALSFLIC